MNVCPSGLSGRAAEEIAYGYCGKDSGQQGGYGVEGAS